MRIFSCFYLFAIICSTCPGAATARNGTADRLPNIIILFADDMGWGDLGSHGHPFAQTPAIDKLVASGCTFDQFYVTAPVCSPSRGGLLTGRIQNRFGMHYLIRDRGPHAIFHHIPVEEPSLARVLKQAGYTTAHIGKWHVSFLGREGEPTMMDYGFDHSLVLGAGRHTSYVDSNWTRNGKRVSTKGRWSYEVYVDEAIDFIEKAGDQPFFVNLWSFAPHQEVDCAPEFRALYADRTEAEQYYFGTISQMDAQYGRLLNYLERKGLTENTVVIFSSDNGPEPHLIPWSNRARGSTNGLRAGKHTLYEGGIRVPGVIRWPGLTSPGSLTHEIAWTADLLATFAALTGVKTPSALPLDGVDLRPALRGGKLARKNPLYWQFSNGVTLRDGKRLQAPGLAIRDGPWKLHSDFDFRVIELYNLDADVSEQWDMKEEQPVVVERMLKTLRSLHADVNGPYSKSANFINPHMPILPDETNDQVAPKAPKPAVPPH